MERAASVSVHIEPDVPLTPEVSGGYGWLCVGGVHVHCHTIEDADRLAEGARELAVMMRLGKVSPRERAK